MTEPFSFFAGAATMLAAQLARSFMLGRIAARVRCHALAQTEQNRGMRCTLQAGHSGPHMTLMTCGSEHHWVSKPSGGGA